MFYNNSLQYSLIITFAFVIVFKIIKQSYFVRSRLITSVWWIKSLPQELWEKRAHTHACYKSHNHGMRYPPCVTGTTWWYIIDILSTTLGPGSLTEHFDGPQMAFIQWNYPTNRFKHFTEPCSSYFRVTGTVSNWRSM